MPFYVAVVCKTPRLNKRQTKIMNPVFAVWTLSYQFIFLKICWKLSLLQFYNKKIKVTDPIVWVTDTKLMFRVNGIRKIVIFFLVAYELRNVLSHDKVSVAQWHRSAESESLRFDSLKGTQKVFFAQRSWKDAEGFCFFSKFLSGLA